MKTNIEQRVSDFPVENMSAQENNPKPVGITMDGLKLPLIDRIYLAVKG